MVTQSTAAIDIAAGTRRSGRSRPVSLSARYRMPDNARIGHVE
jgi:hypothetical protein